MTNKQKQERILLQMRLSCAKRALEKIAHTSRDPVDTALKALDALENLELGKVHAND